MLTGKKIIIFGAGALGRRAIRYFGSRNVHCFADNKRAGVFYCEKPVISFDALCKTRGEYDIVIAVARKYRSEIEQQCLTAGIKDFIHFDNMLNLDDFESDPKLAAFKDKYKGKRCFLIGNGPSLKADDLNILHKFGEISFGCNKIYKIFDKTKWRPDIYCVSDVYFLSNNHETIMGLNVKTELLADPSYMPIDVEMLNAGTIAQSGDICFYSLIIADVSGHSVKFSPDPSRACYVGFSVMYAMLQWAVYMGFSDIYLLGVDHGVMDTKNIVKGEKMHFSDDYIEANDLKYYDHVQDAQSKHDDLTRAYESAESYARRQGVHIYNATRGGQLEVFERVDFNELFHKTK